MFIDAIKSTPWHSVYANEVTQTLLHGTGILRTDYTFEATLATLLHPRNASIALRTYEIPNNTRHRISTGHIPNHDELEIVLVSATNFEAEPFIDRSKIFLEENGYNFTECPEVTIFFKKVIPVYCFVDKDNRRAILIVQKWNILSCWHYLQCGMPKFIPWIFEDAPITEWELEFLNSLRESSPAHYLDLLNEYVGKCNFREQTIRKRLMGYESIAEREVVAQCESNIRTMNGRLDNLRSDFLDTVSKRDMYLYQLAGAQQKLIELEGSSELMEYFLANKNLDFCSADDSGEIVFKVRTYLEYWDEDMAERIIDNKDSVLYHSNYIHTNDRIPPADLKKFLKAVFVDRTIKMRVCAVYKLVITGWISGVSGWNWGMEDNTYIPNPHIQEYHCLGNYEPVMLELVKDKRYMECMEQCVASCKSINFGDGAVMDKFSGYLQSPTYSYINNRGFELPDGSVVTPREALGWIYSQEQEKEENNGEEN